MGPQRTEIERVQLSKKERSVFAQGRLAFAHSDWAGYSVFEEAFTLGHQAGAQA